MQGKVLELIFKHRFSSFNKECQEGVLHQDALWRELVSLAKTTQFGKAYGFDKIEHLKQYKANIPIQSYETSEEYILQMKNGAEDILWPGQIKMFAKSSGTSNSKSKYLPLSKASLYENHFKGGKDILSIYCQHFPNSTVFDGKNVSVAGSFDEQNDRRAIGDLSSLLLANLPPWVEFNRLPKKETALMTDWESKINRISTELTRKNVASISGVPSWNLILLRQVLAKSGVTHLRELWPNFQLYMHGGVNFEPYKKSFEEIVGPGEFTFLETYNASEGFFAIQDKFGDEEVGLALLCNHGVFYEFLPLGDLNKKGTTTIQLEEVKLGISYALIISTKSGLWRYMLGDTIRFTTLQPYRIKLTGRIRYFINVFGEELIEDNSNRALASVCAKLNCEVSEYTVGPIFPDKYGKGGHHWLIEFKKAPTKLSEFKEALDHELMKQNSDYEVKRTADLGLQAPTILSLSKGVFYQWLKAKGKMGGQHKVPRLQNHRKVIDEILKLIKDH